MFDPVSAAFFKSPALALAQSLLGKYIVHEHPEGLLAGRIIETEAYLGDRDQAAHSFNNRRTKRTEIMYHQAGLVYAYQMHTHTLVNVVAGPVGIPHAILIRAIEPIVGREHMQVNRGLHLKEIDLTNGPGKLTKALNITMAYYGHDWTKQPLFIGNGKTINQIGSSPRVGVRNTGEASDYPWRFFQKNNPFVSKYR